MSDLRATLLAVPVPDEAGAEERAWEVVRAAYAEREPAPRRRRLLRPALALAVVAVVAAAALSPPGRAVGGWLRDRVAGEPNAEPALARLPAPRMLLVTSERGAWIVRGDGSKRLLGAYDGASFSPRGLFVVATAGHRLVAVEPNGDPRWSLSRPGRPTDARWSPTPGFRITYREGDTLRVVGGDGNGDHLLARAVAPVAPAWLPRANRTVVAYARADGVVRAVDVESGEELFRTPRTRGVEEILWTPGGRVATLTRKELVVYRRDGRPSGTPTGRLEKGQVLLDAVTVPRDELVYADYDAAAGKTTLVQTDCLDGGACRLIGPRELYTGPGHLRDLALSPDGRWLLAGWPEADQFLFLRLAPPRIRAVDAITREFDPGGTGSAPFPRVAEWCCRPAPAQ
ncbi:MAG TPA: hypothetical protein VH650_03310 [Gaiellaceae bacterium]